jgi:hypothetical protein
MTVLCTAEAVCCNVGCTVPSAHGCPNNRLPEEVISVWELAAQSDSE